MSKTTGKENHTNWFERNPRKTLGGVIGIVVMLCSVVFATVYYQKRIAPVKKEGILNAAFTYRTEMPPYHHDFEKKQVVDTATWGNRLYRLRTNSLRFKDTAPRNVPLKADHYRILFIGDSFTEGVGVPYRQTFVGIIGEALSKYGIEVLNAGVVSYSPIIYWRKVKYLLETKGLDFDEVVVFLDISDVQDEARSYYLDQQGHVKNRILDDKDIQRKVISRIRKKQAVNSFDKLLYILSEFWPYPPEEAGKWTIDSVLFEKFGKAGLRRMTHYMNRLRKVLKSHQIKLKVAVYPWPVQIRAGDADSIQSVYWRHWCDSHGIDFIDYFSVLCPDADAGRRQAMIDKYFIKGDAHLNQAGHRLVARLFLDKFEAEYQNDT